MSHKDILDIWKSKISSRPLPKDKDIFKRMHLGSLHGAVQRRTDEHLYIIHFEMNDVVLLECRGHPKSTVALPLPLGDQHVLWLGLQFLGAATSLHTTALNPDSMFSLMGRHDDGYLITLSPERQWSLYIGIRGESRQQLLAELPTLRHEHEGADNQALPVVQMTTEIRNRVNNLSMHTFGPFSKSHQLGEFVWQAFSAYAAQLTLFDEQNKEEPNIYLYHQAMAYIRTNYITSPLIRQDVADAMNCSVRTLTRAFHGRSVSLTMAILKLRLHKCRELLRKELTLSIEQIAGMLFFSSAKHFTVQYKKEFHKTPREERNLAMKNNANRMLLKSKRKRRK